MPSAAKLDGKLGSGRLFPFLVACVGAGGVICGRLTFVNSSDQTRRHVVAWILAVFSWPRLGPLLRCRCKISIPRLSPVTGTTIRHAHLIKSVAVSVSGSLACLRSLHVHPPQARSTGDHQPLDMTGKGALNYVFCNSLALALTILLAIAEVEGKGGGKSSTPTSTRRSPTSSPTPTSSGSKGSKTKKIKDKNSRITRCYNEQWDPRLRFTGSTTHPLTAEWSRFPAQSPRTVKSRDMWLAEFSVSLLLP